jgi:capsular exopolysaccharide synthesis family protein
MSKIEEALRKAQKSRKNALTQVSQDSGSSIRDLIPLATGTSEISHKSSSSEISLMENGEEFNNNELSELRIIFSDMSDAKIANTYRDLRTKLIQKSQGKNFITMITSCNFSEDSSLASLNIGTAFSFDESKTSLLIDCNLNNPKLDSLLSMETDKGLIDYLENVDIPIDQIMHKTGIKRLKMIPAGSTRETATEYFTSLRMRQLMSDLLARYTDRYIFLDTAPINDSADTKILVELCDFVILVVPYGTTTKNKIKEAADTIGKDKLLGVVFNDIPAIPLFDIQNTLKN